MSFFKEIAIMGIIAIELYALHLGINGIALASSLAMLSGIAGFKYNKEIKSAIKTIKKV